MRGGFYDCSASDAAIGSPNLISDPSNWFPKMFRSVTKSFRIGYELYKGLYEHNDRVKIEKIII